MFQPAWGNGYTTTNLPASDANSPFFPETSAQSVNTNMSSQSQPADSQALVKVNEVRDEAHLALDSIFTLDQGIEDEKELTSKRFKDYWIPGAKQGTLSETPYLQGLLSKREVAHRAWKLAYNEETMARSQNGDEQRPSNGEVFGMGEKRALLEYKRARRKRAQHWKKADKLAKEWREKNPPKAKEASRKLKTIEPANVAKPKKQLTKGSRGRKT
jgi:hypothetical protein